MTTVHIPTIETARLTLRPFRDDDLDDYAALMADPVVMRYIGDGKTATRDETWRSMAMLLGHWHLRGYGLWAMEEKDTGRLIGRTGLFNPEGWPGLEVGWLLGQAHWGKGYATEGALAALAFAWETLGAKRVISVIQRENDASIRVAKRIGEAFLEQRAFKGHDVVIYAIDRPPAR